jgi:hypothetical protein
MSKIVSVSQSNYRLIVQNGGNVTLDVGTPSSGGTVTITGNLDVKGVTTTIESTNTTVADNILQLNYGATGNGISSALNYQSGIEIERGAYSAAQFVFDDSVSHFNPVTNSNINGTFVMKTADSALSGLQVGVLAGNAGTNFVIDLQAGNGILTLANSTNYYLRVANSNDIPNLQYLQYYVASTYVPGTSNQGVAKVDRVFYPISGTLASADSSIQTTNTSINFAIAQNARANINSTGLNVDNINVYSNTISNTSLLNNLVLSAVNNAVEINAVLNLDDQSTTYTSVANKTQIYSRSSQTTLAQTPGRTGLFFVNQINNDELVAKNRALLFSILF